MLVNNAGLALGLEPAHRASLSDWDLMIGTNVTGLVHVTRALLPGMVARNAAMSLTWARSPERIRIRAATCTAAPRLSCASSR